MFKTCPICDREVGGEMELHHLKPATFSTRTKEVHDKNNLVLIHRICHRKIHATFCERELLSHYHTVERIREHEEIIKFVKWISKKPVEFYDKCEETTDRKSKRKR